MSQRTVPSCLMGISLVLVFVLTACAVSVKPYTSAEDVRQTSLNDVRLWALSDKFDEELKHTNRIYQDAGLQNYLQGIINRLYPEYSGKIHIQVFNSSSLNAFALSNGSLYIHTSLLARCDNEAQAATILGHEAAHFVDRHSLRQTEQAQSITAFANVLTLAGIPLVGPLLSISSMMGYSQALESTADRLAYERMMRAGYDTHESLLIFQRLADETKNMSIEEPFFFSTHPRMAERVASIDAMLKEQPPSNGERGEEVFLTKTSELRLASLEEDLSMNRFNSVIMLLEGKDQPPGYPNYYKFYLGEAYRQRGGDDDVNRAFQMYKEAIIANPEFAPSYRSLGLYYLKQKDYENARYFLEIYLQRSPNAGDKDYIRNYIEAMGKGDKT